MPRVEFLFDFGSPNAYLAHLVIPGIEGRTGARFDYVPILLGGVFKATGNRSPIEAFGGVRNKLAYESLEMERFQKRHAITLFTMNPHFPVNTLTLMRGAVAARRLGVFAAYVDAMFKAMWADGLKLDDPAVLSAALADAGLDAARILSLAQDQEVKAELAAGTADAVERGAFGSPTFFVDGAIFFGKDRLRDVEEAIAAAKS